MSETLYVVTIGLPLITLLLIFGMKYWSTVQQAKARLASDEAYRKLAETSATAQAEAARALSAMELMLADVQRRVAAVEKMIKEVD